MKSVFVITTPEVIDNERASFGFIGKVPVKDPLHRTLSDYLDNWGQIRLSTKGNDYLDPFAWAAAQRGEDHGRIVGDDGTPRLNINVWNDGRMVFGAGYDYKPQDQQNNDDPLRHLLAHLPDRTSLLMPEFLFEHFQSACKAESVEVHAYHHPEPISSS